MEKLLETSKRSLSKEKNQVVEGCVADLVTRAGDGLDQRYVPKDFRRLLVASQKAEKRD